VPDPFDKDRDPNRTSIKSVVTKIKFLMSHNHNISHSFFWLTWSLMLYGGWFYNIKTVKQKLEPAFEFNRLKTS